MELNNKSFEIEKHHHHHHIHFTENNIIRRANNKTRDECKKMWEIAAPAILTTVAQFSIGFVTIAFVGHLWEVELAAVSVVQNVLEGFVYVIMALSFRLLLCSLTDKRETL